MTVHIRSKKDEIAKIVLMPGDPLRAKWIAENYLENYKLVNDIRGMLAYTGIFNETQVTVMGHGMGNPSIGIYSYELFKFYDVDLIIRIGSAGSYVNEIKLNDVLLVKNSYSISTYHKMLGVKVKNNTLPSWDKINSQILEEAKLLNIEVKLITVNSSDTFYSSINLDKIIESSKAQAVEMESFALFANALKLNKKAACILTCSDSLLNEEKMSPEEREKSLHKMILLALNSLKRF
ncbi:MAG: purine-nucleoside phosphorylase [Mycoplasmoidaceae bacterium]